jgi:hypothetical protein
VFTNHQRRICLDAAAIGKLERGDTRWPAAWVRAGLRAVFGVESDAEIGLYIVKNFALPGVAGGQTATRTGEPDGTSADASAGAVVSCAADAVGKVSNVHVTVPVGARVTLAFGGGGGADGGQPVRVVVTEVDEQPLDLDGPIVDGARVYSMAAWRGRR